MLALRNLERSATAMEERVAATACLRALRWNAPLKKMRVHTAAQGRSPEDSLKAD